jgi:uncharacterized protein (TIGR02996 family)
MSGQDDFLTAVLERPDDDTLRLVYADWLQERGDPRAEFIRVQIALASAAPDDPQVNTLQSYERDLLAEHSQNWCVLLGLEPEQCVFRRGFVEAVEIHAGQFLKAPEKVLQAAPVRRVHFLHATNHIRELAGCHWLEKISTLDLSGNAIRDDGAAALAASPHLTNLATLNLSGCEIHAEGAVHLADTVFLSHLQELQLAGCGIGADGLRAILRSRGLQRVTALDVRGNHQCWISPNAGELWLILTETNIKDDGVRLLAESPEAARLTSIDLSLNLIEEGGWDALIASPHLGAAVLNVFECSYAYPTEVESGAAPAGVQRTPNEEISDVLCLALPGGRRRPVPRQSNDPRWIAPPCTLDAGTCQRLRDRFGRRVTFTPPAVRYGAHFHGTRSDWFGMRAVLDPPAS